MVQRLWSGPGALLPHHGRSILAYALLNAPLVWWTIVPFTPHSGMLRFSVRATGIASLVLILATLAVTPLAKQLGRPDLVRYRRALGLSAFLYALVHTVIYVWTSQMWEASLTRFLRRRYIIVGIAALFFMIPLAVTSTRAAVARMGPERWRRLHLAVWPALALTLLHYAMPAYTGGYWRIYAVIGLMLLGWRLWRARTGGQ